MESSKMSMVLLMVTVLAVNLAEAQQTATCANKLVPCASYLNSTNPPASCCNPIKEAMATEKDCLCNLYNTPGFLQSLGLDINKALRLTRACGVDADVNMCKATASSPTHSVMSPPGVAGGDTGSGSRVTWTGISTVVLFSAAAMLR